MAKIRGFYRDENGMVQEMEGTSNEHGVVSFPRVPTAGILVEGVDMSDISPVYMTPPENSAQDENVVPVKKAETFEDLLNEYVDSVYHAGTKEEDLPPYAEQERQAILDYVKRLEARQIPPAMIARWLEVRREFDAQGAIQVGKVWTAIDDIWEMFDAYMLANVYRKDDEG
jgi:hypothetical protein